MCHIKGCRQEARLFFYNVPICDGHWKLHCDGKINLKEILKIKEGPVGQISTPLATDRSLQSKL